MAGVRYHSRHIPREWLNFDTPVGREVARNGLCDVLDGDMPGRLKDCGVGLIETRAVWWEMEPEPGRYEFARLERDLAKIERAGLEAGVFAWFQHPPRWYDPGHDAHVRFRCREHDADSTILSLWDPRTLETYDRLYAELARRTRGRLSFLYAGISGDFGEVAYPSGVRHYLFSPPHNHEGFWCADRLARASFAGALARQYGTLDRLNAAWQTRFDRWDDAGLLPPLPMAGNPLPRRRDFARWYTDSLTTFTEAVCAVVRRHFPDLAVAIPLGFPFEKLEIGQVKSLAVKAAARHGMIARWTGMAFLGSFDRSNVLARRFATPAHFYGCPFATEAALTLSRENAAHGLYEALANGASIIHDDPQNILRAEPIHRELRPMLRVSPPACRVAVLYPLEDELLELAGFDVQAFVQRAAAWRVSADYHLCDGFMICDGFLDRVQDLVVLVSTTVPAGAAERIGAFLARGGALWLCGDSKLAVLGADARVGPWPAHLGQPRRVDGFPVLEPYATLGAGREAAVFHTVHEDFVSIFRAGSGQIEIGPC